ncbi:MAG: ammonium transporter [Acidimicrobiia bacterium]|nr:ammonium transporter [Acidimicrobiia bacterium]
MLAVILLFAGIYWVAGPATQADPDSTGAETGTAPSALCVSGEAASLNEDGECVVDPENLAAAVEKNRVSVNLTWLVVAGALVFFMQAGFAMVETGFTRAKNASHVIMTNYVVFALATLGFMAFGFSFMYGGLADLPNIGFKQFGEPLVSVGGWNFLSGGGWFLGGSAYDVGVLAFFFFQLMFVDTMATIPTGAMAERWKFSAFCVFALVAGAFIYPLVGNWVWGNGWLANLGVNLGLGNGAVDFAGSGVVHAVGGVTALMGAIVLGPRLGKYNKDGTASALPAHNIPMGIIGTIILFFGWIGFNGGSTLGASDFRFTIVIVNTILAGCMGAVVAMLVVKAKFGKFDPSMAANGGLAGLVAITAPCAFVAPWAALLIGGIGGGVVVFSILLVDRLRVDDPVGAVSVHGVCGIWGVLAVGIFADGSYAYGLNGDGALAPVEGLIRGNVGQFGAQLVYAVALVVVISTITYTFFRIQDRIQGIRVSPEDELQGVDIPEMGVEAYPVELEISPGVYASHPVGAGGPTLDVTTTASTTG